ncbi:MAG: hypothetical protein IMZ53_13705 [Thermoplasmata archaeon]|nr:hypothetical protein [Thermoplasmata archaeon]MBE3141626.1 hypothetical protein [Thermoplasmata archaeon]
MKKLIKNKIVTIGIIGIFLLTIFGGLAPAASRPSYISITLTDKYSIDLDFLPPQISEIMFTKGYRLRIAESAQIPLWKGESKSLLFKQVATVIGHLVRVNLTLPENDYTDENITIYLYVTIAKNRLGTTLFYQESCIALIKKTNIPLMLRLPNADTHINRYRLAWFMNDVDERNSDNSVYGQGEFYNRRTQKTLRLWSCVTYDLIGNYNGTGGVNFL